MNRLLRWPLIIAAIVVVLRVVVEQSAAPNVVANLLSVVLLHFLIGPIYFAICIARSAEPRPYSTLLKTIALYVVLTRAMVLPTYWLAYFLGWQQNRFGGLAGASPFVGYVTIPFLTAARWIVASMIFGGVLGSVIVAIARRFPKS